MKQNLINRENNAPKSGKLSIALYPNPLSKSNGKASSYFARVVNRSRLGMDDIFNDLLSEDSGIDTAQMKKTWNMVINAIAMRISSGISIDFGLGTLYPSVSGSFASEQSEFNRSRHSITVQYRPSEEMKRTMADLEPVITRGNACRPELTRVYDYGSGWDSRNLKEGQSLEQGILSVGNLLIMEGKMLKIAGDSEENGLYFDCLSNPEASVKLSPSLLCRNQPTLLECIVPKGLAKDELYCLRVVTQFLPGNKVREYPQSFSFPSTFTLASGISD